MQEGSKPAFTGTNAHTYTQKRQREIERKRENSLDLNVKKTKEMMTDFRKVPTVIPDFFIDGVKVQRVTEYKYLGTVLDNKLDFNKNTDFIHKRSQPRIFCFQKLRFNVSAAVLCTFYKSCVGSVFTFLFLCWFSHSSLECEKKKCPE